jgi:Cys-tRNA(Pro)/Cys-tRNA(Cys) deacylase
MAKKRQQKLKLNAMRVLEAQGVPYEVFTYPPVRHSAVEVAELAGVPPAQVFKTLVVEREEGKPLLVVVAGDCELNLKRLAAAVGEKKLHMASQRDAERLTGLQVGGISPLALLNRGFEIVADRTVEDHSQVYVSAGQRGINLRLAAADLLRVTGARIVEATDEDTQ